MISTADARLLLRLVPGRPAFVVVDGRADPPAAAEVFVRPWAADGLRLRALDGTLADLPALVRAGRVADPVIVIGPVELDLCAAGPVIPVHVRGGQLIQGDRPVDDLDDPGVPTGGGRVALRGAVDLLGPDAPLPVTVRARLTRATGRNLVRVAGDAPELPPPRWFAVDGRGDVTLTVDVRPAAGGDRWQLTARRGTTALPVRPVPDPPGAAGTVRHLGLVFDCTCPARDCWSPARALALGYTADPIGDEPWPEPIDFNRPLRRGLVQALTEQLGPDPVTFAVSWFADAAEGGVASLDHLGDLLLPAIKTVCLPGRRLDELADTLAACTYCPGLDLWDPLEDALSETVDTLLPHDRAGAGVLIVGNSPPNLPLQADSPFWELLDFHGRQTTVRRMNAKFTTAVRDADTAGLPIVYLFLTHDRCLEGDRHELNVYQAMQAAVQRALAAYVHVIAVPADEDGLARGVAQALAYFRYPPVSGVRLSLP